MTEKKAPKKGKVLSEIQDFAFNIPAEAVQVPAIELPQDQYHPGILVDMGAKALRSNSLPDILSVLGKINKLLRVYGAEKQFPKLVEIRLLLLNRQSQLEK